MPGLYTTMAGNPQPKTAGVSLPDPMSQTEQRAQQLTRIESFYEGIDTIDAKLDPVSRDQFAQMLTATDNPQEARAAAVNKAYVAYTQPNARDAIEGQWPTVRAQMAQSIGINKPEVTDTELYQAIGVRVKESQENRAMAGELVAAVQMGALEGRDWMQTYSEFIAMNKKPGAPVKRMDELRQMAEGAYHAIATRAHAVAPVVSEVAGLLTEAKDDANPLDSDAKESRRERMIDAILRLDGADRSLAIQLAAQKVAREQPATERGGLEKAGEALARGVQSVAMGAKNQIEAFLADQMHVSGRAPANVSKDLAERRQVMREIFNAYTATADPVKGQNVVTQGLLNISGMLPQLGLIANPLVGVPLILAHAQDARQGELEAQGVPRGQAAAVGLVQGTIDTALQFVTSNMILGKIMPGGSGVLGAAHNTADLLKRVATIGAIETGTMSAVTAAQLVGPLLVQDMAQTLGAQVPGVNWQTELEAFKYALPETVATLVPMLLLGTGAATFREVSRFSDYTADKRNLEAVGFSEKQSGRIAAIENPIERVRVIQDEWTQREPVNQTKAIAELDAELAAKSEESSVGITTNPDGSYRVANADESIVFDNIAEPAEAQRTADALLNRDSPAVQAIDRLADAIKPRLDDESLAPVSKLKASDRARMRAEEEGGIEQPAFKLSEWIKGKLPLPDEAAAAGDPLAGELRAVFDAMRKEVTTTVGRGRGQAGRAAFGTKTTIVNDSAARAFFAKPGQGAKLDALTESAREAGFEFETPADLLTALSDSLKGIETTSYGVVRESVVFGIAAPMPDWLKPVGNRIREIAAEIGSLPAFTPFKQALNKWVGRGQVASLEIRQTTRQIERAVPDPVAREGITAWLQANGDKTVLAGWAKNSSRVEFKRGYEAALKLTPQQVRVAERLRDFYRDMLVTLQANGLVDHGVENYVSQIWKKQNPVTGKESDPKGPRLVTDLKHAKERTFGNYFEGEQLGFEPVTKDISKLMALYANSVSKVIATREFIKELTTKKGSDGRPLAAPFGNRALSTATEGDPVYIKPLAKDADTLDYRTIEGQPALTKWKWIGEHEGADAYMEGQLGLHPEIYTHVRNALGRSIIRDWYAERSGPLMQTVKDTVKLVDKLGQVTKGTMLGFFSPFHVVQEGTHAVGHLVNPFSHLPDLDPATPLVRNAVSHGLMLAGDGEGMRHFKDSIDANLANRLPVLGKLSQQFTEWMFHDYIPQLKLKTYEAIQERNTKRYAKDLTAKKVSQGEIDYLSAQQTNAAYGHLNYADLNRNPTLQHIAQILLLAPDFLEARGRFAGQAVKGLAGRAGQEQLKALAVLGVTQWMTARILNQLLDDDWHFDHPFDVVVGNRKYTMRSVPEDIFKLVADPRRFAMGRISPLIGRGIFQLGTGKNWRGEKVDYSDTFKELATAWVPIALRATPFGRELTATDRANPISPWEQFIGSIGLHISRKSPVAEAYKLAGKFKEKEGVKEDTGTYPVSDYQALRYALEDDDLPKAAAEIAKLKASGKKNLASGFHSSLFHSYTGKDQPFEQRFRQSQDEEGKHIIEASEEARRKIWARFSEVLSSEQAQNPEPEKKKAASVTAERGKDGRVSRVRTDGETSTTYNIERDPKTGRITRLIPVKDAA